MRIRNNMCTVCGPEKVHEELNPGFSQEVAG